VRFLLVQYTALSVQLESTSDVRMNADQYLVGILRRELVNTGTDSPVRGVLTILRPTIAQWANKYLVRMAPSGSFVKGTANSSGTDIDIFISLAANTPDNLKDIYNSMFAWMQGSGYTPKQQNVSINIRVGAYVVDLVPAKRQDAHSNDHSLYRRRANTWTKTNVTTHIAYVQRAQRINETRIIKLWRNQKGLDFPSFYLELTVIDALKGARVGNLSANVVTVLEYLRDRFEYARVVDPANTNNIISDDMTAAEQAMISAAATRTLGATWGDLVK
jgi:hypothetical protein